ncbi:hypothetical protein [Vibrio fluvialis]|uniref:hypothetical protein n=1 Tax=Vibrio fluvialis TaxID=676 RepID=UPI0028F7228F|nr:hypothetical protein [Vibrio fluvialis]
MRLGRVKGEWMRVYQFCDVFRGLEAPCRHDNAINVIKSIFGTVSGSFEQRRAAKLRKLLNEAPQGELVAFHGLYLTAKPSSAQMQIYNEHYYQLTSIKL